jgi:hypothetical protein
MKDVISCQRYVFENENYHKTFIFRYIKIIYNFMSSFNLSTSFCKGYNCNIVFHVKIKDNIHFIFQLNMQALIVAWQCTHNKFIKLITRTNVSCLDLDIHKSKEVIVVTHESKVRITYCSMVLATNVGMAC